VINKVKKNGNLTVLEDRISQLNNENLFVNFNSRFPSSFNHLLDNNNYDLNKIDKFITFYDFCTGKWLEDLVLITLQKLQEEGEINVKEIKNGVEADYNNRKTEIDILVIKGYEMFLISCTTSQKIKVVKQKAFEAIYRAQQLGGEHAKVVVVSPMYNRRGMDGNRFSRDNNLEELEKDLSQFDAARNAGQNLIGINELRKELGLSRQGVSLSERLIGIIEG
jgi:hypothetical protein